MANNLEFRVLVTRTLNASGGMTETQVIEYRTKDVIASVLGIIPLALSWSEWARVDVVTVVVDQSGNPV